MNTSQIKPQRMASVSPWLEGTGPPGEDSADFPSDSSLYERLGGKVVRGVMVVEEGEGIIYINN
jgi:hypothetical protein